MVRYVNSIFASTVAIAIAQNAFCAESESITGYLDTYYQYNFNKPSPRHVPNPVNTDPNSAAYKGLVPGGTQLRNFDVQDNQFTLASAEISYFRSVDNLSLRLDLVTGDNTDMMHASSGSVDETSKHIGQAIVSYKPDSFKSITINFGKMLSHVGWEGAKAKDNWNYSRSLLYAFAAPYWHNGLAISWEAIPEVFVGNFYIYNGWNNMNDSNRSKTFGVQLAYKPSAGLSITYNAIGGPEQEENEKNKRIVHDLILTWAINEQFAIASDWIVGSEEKAITNANDKISDAHWSALQLGMKYSPNESFYLSPRLESFWDREGFTTGASQTIREATLTASYRPSSKLEMRLEGRQDISTRNSFEKDKDPSHSQSTITLSSLVTL